MQLLITIKQPFRVWVSVVSAASAFVVKSSDNIVEANIPTSSKSDRVERLIAGSRGDRIPSYFQRSQFPLHPSSPRCSLRMEYPLREEDDRCSGRSRSPYRIACLPVHAFANRHKSGAKSGRATLGGLVQYRARKQAAD